MPVVPDCFWIQKGDGGPEELQGFAKTWRSNMAQYSAENVLFSAFFSTDIHFF